MQRVCQSMQKLNKHMDEYWKYLHMNAIIFYFFFSVAVLKIWHLSCATLRCDGIRNHNWLNKSLPIVSHFLQAVIHGQEKSRWLRSFLSDNRRRVVNIYLEDDHQLDQVYCYLNELYTAAVANAPCVADVKSMDRVPFVLDVLLPEVS